MKRGTYDDRPGDREEEENKKRFRAEMEDDPSGERLLNVMNEAGNAIHYRLPVRDMVAVLITRKATSTPEYLARFWETLCRCEYQSPLRRPGQPVTPYGMVTAFAALWAQYEAMGEHPAGMASRAKVRYWEHVYEICGMVTRLVLLRLSDSRSWAMGARVDHFLRQLPGLEDVVLPRDRSSAFSKDPMVCIHPGDEPVTHSEHGPVRDRRAFDVGRNNWLASGNEERRYAGRGPDYMETPARVLFYSTIFNVQLPAGYQPNFVRMALAWRGDNQEELDRQLNAQFDRAPPPMHKLRDGRLILTPPWTPSRPARYEKTAEGGFTIREKTFGLYEQARPASRVCMFPVDGPHVGLFVMDSTRRGSIHRLRGTGRSPTTFVDWDHHPSHGILRGQCFAGYTYHYSDGTKPAPWIALQLAFFVSAIDIDATMTWLRWARPPGPVAPGRGTHRGIIDLYNHWGNRDYNYRRARGAVTLALLNWFHDQHPEDILESTITDPGYITLDLLDFALCGDLDAFLDDVPGRGRRVAMSNLVDGILAGKHRKALRPMADRRVHFAGDRDD